MTPANILRFRARSRPQCGMGSIEFIVAGIPLLLLGLATLEALHAYAVRQTVNFALAQAARAGSLHHGHPDVIHEAFEKGLAPLFGGRSADRIQATQSALDRRRQALGRPPWQLHILSPSEQAFAQFPAPYLRIAQQTGLPAIDNNYLREQHAAGSATGADALNSPDIFHANTLALKVIYAHKPLVAVVASLLRPLGREYGTYREHLLARGYLPIQQNVSVVMQSHPVLWSGASSAWVSRPPGPPVDDQVLQSGRPANGFSPASPLPPASAPGWLPPAAPLPADSPPRIIDANGCFAG